jgi:hypothetical protein
MNTPWFPEIVYSADEEEVGGFGDAKIPMIVVPEEESMPKMLFMWESNHTGEFEPNELGDPVPIVEMELHQYADMDALKQNMTEADYNKVRLALNLLPLKEAVAKGRKITDSVRANVTKKAL